MGPSSARVQTQGGHLLTVPPLLLSLLCQSDTRLQWSALPSLSSSPRVGFRELIHDSPLGCFGRWAGQEEEGV